MPDVHTVPEYKENILLEFWLFFFHSELIELFDISSMISFLKLFISKQFMIGMSRFSELIALIIGLSESPKFTIHSQLEIFNKFFLIMTSSWNIF